MPLLSFLQQYNTIYDKVIIHRSYHTCISLSQAALNPPYIALINTAPLEVKETLQHITLKSCKSFTLVVFSTYHPLCQNWREEAGYHLYY